MFHFIIKILLLTYVHPEERSRCTSTSPHATNWLPSQPWLKTALQLFWTVHSLIAESSLPDKWAVVPLQTKPPDFLLYKFRSIAFESLLIIFEYSFKIITSQYTNLEIRFSYLQVTHVIVAKVQPTLPDELLYEPWYNKPFICMYLDYHMLTIMNYSIFNEVLIITKTNLWKMNQDTPKIFHFIWLH